MIVYKTRGKGVYAPDGSRVLPVSSKHVKPHIVFESRELKHCSKCNTWRPLSKFKYRRQSVDGLQSFCVSCHNLLAGVVKPFSRIRKRKGIVNGK